MLVLSCRLLIFLMGKRISSMVIVFFFEVQHQSQVVQGLLAQDKVVRRRRAIADILNNIRFQMNPFAVRVAHKGYLDIVHLFGLKGAVGSAP
jgi:hypothetical protein